MVSSAFDDRLIRSRHLSYFERYGEVFAYHNLFGFILGMSADVAAFLEYHRDEMRSDADRRRTFEEQFGADMLEEFAAIFRIHQCLVESDAAERARAWTLCPIRGPWTVWHQPTQDSLTLWRSPRGGSTEAEPQPTWASILWSRMDGEQRLSALFEGLAKDGAIDDSPEARATFLDRVFSWVHHERQYAKLSLGPLSRYGPQHRWPPYLRSTMPYDPWDPSGPAPERVLEKLGVPIEPPHAYYADEVSEAAEQFRSVETTLSHLFRAPHDALGGKTYAERLAESLVRVGYLSADTKDIVEIGGGLGHVAAGVLSFIRERFPEANITYTIFDLSPALAQAQQSTLAEAGHRDWIEQGRVRWVMGNAEALPLPDSSADLVLSNEVIGDLTTLRLKRDEVLEPTADLGPHAEPIRTLELDDFADANEEFYVNVGAIRLIQRLARVLRPGGGAMLTEYGDGNRYPIASTQLDHLEFSIHFAPLMKAAHQLGLEPHLNMLQDVIGLNRDVQTLGSTRTWFHSMRALFASLGGQLDKRAYTRKELQEALGPTPLDTVGVLRFDYVDQRVMGLAPHEFRALFLKRPAAPQ